MGDSDIGRVAARAPFFSGRLPHRRGEKPHGNELPNSGRTSININVCGSLVGPTSIKRYVCSVGCGARPRTHTCLSLRTPKGVVLHWRSSTAISSHIGYDLVVPDTVPQADICFTRRVFGRIVPLAACGPKVWGSFAVVNRINTRQWPGLDSVTSCGYGTTQTTIPYTQAYNRNSR